MILGRLTEDQREDVCEWLFGNAVEQGLLVARVCIVKDEEYSFQGWHPCVVCGGKQSFDMEGNWSCTAKDCVTVCEYYGTHMRYGFEGHSWTNNSQEKIHKRRRQVAVAIFKAKHGFDFGVSFEEKLVGAKGLVAAKIEQLAMFKTINTIRKGEFGDGITGN